jgi:hypothetical protein
MKTVFRLTWAALLVPALIVSACGGDDSGSDTSDESYDEGSVRMEIETLDTGLLKGHSYVEAADGWSIEELHVTAKDEAGQSWPVIEIPEETETAKATLFFEVTIQELPRGDQVTITTVTKFKSEAGLEVERTAADIWPP